MKATHSFALTSLLVLTLAGCTQEGADRTTDQVKTDARIAAEKTQSAAEKAVDATKNTAERVADKTVEIAGKTVDKTKEIAGATADVVTDSWITTTIAAKFADETILDGSRITVDTNDHVVTLKGTVRSAAAKSKAGSVAKGTRGVTRVVNQIQVK